MVNSFSDGGTVGDDYINVLLEWDFFSICVMSYSAAADSLFMSVSSFCFSIIGNGSCVHTACKPNMSSSFLSLGLSAELSYSFFHLLNLLGLTTQLESYRSNPA